MYISFFHTPPPTSLLGCNFSGGSSSLHHSNHHYIILLSFFHLIFAILFILLGEIDDEKVFRYQSQFLFSIYPTLFEWWSFRFGSWHFFVKSNWGGGKTISVDFFFDFFINYYLFEFVSFIEDIARTVAISIATNVPGDLFLF